MNFIAIIWNAKPEVFSFMDVPRWYGVFFALAFYLGIQALTAIYRKEQSNLKDLEKQILYILIGTVVGARLGHCLFYDPIHYLTNPIKILKIWEGGLASHGATIGILFAVYLFSRIYTSHSYLWYLDRLVICIAISGVCIRTGNFMNSEIIGKPTNNQLGVVFVRSVYNDLMRQDKKIIDDISFEHVYHQTNQTNQTKDYVNMNLVLDFIPTAFKEKKYMEKFVQRDVLSSLQRMNNSKQPHILTHTDSANFETKIVDDHYQAIIPLYGIARHPAQMYEAFYCILIFLLLFFIWKNIRDALGEGFILGLFLTLLFSLRFLDEFLKENQEAFEDGLLLNMGQMLSIPLVLIGIILMIYAQKNKTLIH